MRKRFGDFAESELSIKPGGDGGNGHLTSSQGSSRKHRGRSRGDGAFDVSVGRGALEAECGIPFCVCFSRSSIHGPGSVQGECRGWSPSG